MSRSRSYHRETKVGNRKWVMGSKKVHDCETIIFVQCRAKGIQRRGILDGMTVAVMSTKSVGCRSVGSSAGDGQTNSSLTRICGITSGSLRSNQGYGAACVLPSVDE